MIADDILMKVVIFGCGRTGSTLALQLSSLGHDVTVIEKDPSALRRLGAEHGCKIVIGSGLDDDTLQQAGIQTADIFFTLTRGDNTNLMAAQIVRIRYKIERICVKVADPYRAEEYRKLGFECVNPSALTAGLMRAWMTGEEFQSVNFYNTLQPEQVV